LWWSWLAAERSEAAAGVALPRARNRLFIKPTQIIPFFEIGSDLVIQSSPNKTYVVLGGFLTNGAERRVRRGRVFLDFFVVQVEVQEPQIQRFSGGRIFIVKVVHNLCALYPPTRSRSRKAPLITKPIC
jgi:hypothetical protein